MTPLFTLLAKGGPVMIAILVLSVVLYSSCLKLLLTLRAFRRQWAGKEMAGEPALLSRCKEELRATFRQQRVAIGAMIAAAPLLGLLGTVNGMVKTFESLSVRAGDKSMEGLAGGISEVLVATESGLTVALPALLLVHLAHREMSGQLQEINRREFDFRKKAVS